MEVLGAMIVILMMGACIVGAEDFNKNDKKKI